MDSGNTDMRAIETTKDEVRDRTGWRRIVSAAATPQPTGSGYKKKKNIIKSAKTVMGTCTFCVVLIRYEYLLPRVPHICLG